MDNFDEAVAAMNELHRQFVGRDWYGSVAIGRRVHMDVYYVTVLFYGTIVPLAIPDMCGNVVVEIRQVTTLDLHRWVNDAMWRILPTTDK